MDELRLLKIRELTAPILSERQVELVELTCHPQGRQTIIRFLVDRVGGINLQQCAQLNQRIGQVMEAADVFEGSYTVEVSSPGLDRPLTTQRDFERALGEDLTMDVRIDEDRFREIQGMLLAVQPDAVVLKTPQGNCTIPLVDIRIARKTLRW